MNRRSLLLAASAIFLPSFPALAQAPATLKMTKNPNCGCCTGHAEHLRAAGYVVEITESDQIDALRATRGVPEELAGCHFIEVDGYLIEGHVPAAAIDKLLAERPAIKGIAVPGMPQGSPGMSGERTEPLVVFTIEASPQSFFTE